MSRLLCFSLCCCAPLATSAGATVITVGAGMDAQTIPDALAMAADGDELALASGTWFAAAAGEPVILLQQRALTIRALDASDPPILDGGALGRALVVDGGAVILEDLVLRGGTVSGGDIDGDGLTADWERSGGAVTVHAALATLRRVEVDGGSAFHGGGLGAWDSSLVLENVDISTTAATFFGGGVRVHGGAMHWSGGSLDGCTADTGGALVAGGGAKLTINAVTASNCTATWYGGGMYCDSSQSAVDTALTDVTVDQCQAGQSGGGLYVYGGTLSAQQLQVTSCTAVDGAGIDAIDAALTMTGGILADNAASDEGGAIRAVDGSAQLNQVSISGNQAVYGAGVMLDWCDWAGLNALVLRENVATLRGGALYATGAFDVTVEDCAVSENGAGLGAGGLEFAGSSTGLISGSSFCGQAVHVEGAWQDDGGNTFESVCAGAPCVGDVDGSGAIDLADLIGLIEAWGSGPGVADCDGDGSVDVRDLIWLLKRWGAPC